MPSVAKDAEQKAHTSTAHRMQTGTTESENPGLPWWCSG